MQIYPHDLGTKQQMTVIRFRAGAMSGQQAAAAAMTAEPEPGARPGFLGRLWIRGTGIKEDVAAHSLYAMRGVVYGMTAGFVGGSTGFLLPGIIAATQGQPVLGAVFTTLGAAFAGVGLIVPGVMFRRLHTRALSASEVEALLPFVHDDLERAYLTLAVDAIRQPVSSEAAKEVRAALRALGEAIGRLPLSSGHAADMDTLRQEADEALTKARTEPDRVIADSLERRAEALLRRADAHERSALLMRRAAALREELAAQTEALRAGLTSFDIGSGGGGAAVAGLAHLAEAVRGVAAEAVSVATAREELDAPSPVMSHPLPKVDEQPQQVLRGQ